MTSPFTIRPIAVADNQQIAEIIRSVSAEYGLTAEAGYAVGDAALDNMTAAYQAPRSRYWVIEAEGRILGGGGLAPLAGKTEIAELQKMYLSAGARGQGLGRRLAETALEFARQQGFPGCYLETTAGLTEAISLYERLGFITLSAPLGCSGHSVCEVRMFLAFNEAGRRLVPDSELTATSSPANAAE